MATIYARLKFKYNFKYQTVFSAEFGKQNEDGQMLDEIELFISSKINQILLESHIDNIDVSFQLDQQIQKQEMNNSGWRFVEITSMTMIFFTKLLKLIFHLMWKIH